MKPELQRALKTRPQRNRRILELAKEGESFMAIGKHYGISRQRVYQIYEQELKRENKLKGLDK